MTAQRQGMGLIELIVALVLLSVGVLGLAGSALLAQRNFNRAAAVEASARAAAAILDSLVHVPAPVAGSRVTPGLAVSWQVSRGNGLVQMSATVVAFTGDTTTRRSEWHAARAE